MGHSYQRGLILFRQSRFKLAQEEFRSEIAEYPQSAVAHAMLGMTLLNLKDRKGAEAEIHEAVRLGPDVSYCHYALAHLALVAGHGWFARHFRDQHGLVRRRLLESKKHTLEAIRLDSKSMQNWRYLAWLECQLMLWRPALQATEQGLAIQPTDPQCLNLRAKALLALGRQMEAGQTLDHAIAHDPENAATHLQRGWFVLGKGDYVSAVEHFTQSVRLDPTQPRAIAALTQARLARFALYRWPLRLLLRSRAGRDPLSRSLTRPILVQYFITSFLLFFGVSPLVFQQHPLVAAVGIEMFPILWLIVAGMAVREWYRTRRSR